jgi:coenzyme F420-0:L-glutamate ligase/coenzyme F420-1:gamma-L-glutamate ligase
MTDVRARALPGLPEIARGADLAELIVAAAESSGQPLDDTAVVAIAHKAVSKAEGAVVALSEVTAGDEAKALASRLGKPDPRVVQVVLDECVEVVRAERGVIIGRTRHGFICANAGVDTSNAAHRDELVLLPRDPDGSARQLRRRLHELTGVRPAVVISDSFGRAWRHGQVDIAVGCAGLVPLQDWRGRQDSVGLELQATMIAAADSAAAMADLARAKDSREPVVMVYGLGSHISEDDGPGAAALLRATSEDLFR